MKQLLTYSGKYKPFQKLPAFFLLAFIFWVSAVTVHAQALCIPAYYTGCPSCTFYNCGEAQSNFSNININGEAGTSINDNYNICTGNGYQDRTSVISAVQLQQGLAYTAAVTMGDDDYEQTIQFWIDFNDDSVFEPNERVDPLFYNPCCSAFTGSSSPLNVTLNIPLTAQTGTHIMRIREARTFALVDSLDPCNSTTTYTSGSSSFSMTLFNGDSRDYLVTILAAPSCSGFPSASLTPFGNIHLCVGGTETLTGTAGVYSGLSYQWQQYSGSSWADVPGYTGLMANFTVASAPIIVRMRVICSYSSDSSFSNVDTLTPGNPTYATVPYFQDFENWQNYCSVNDVPDGHWANHPAASDSSWRRDDEGNLAGWTNISSVNSWPSNSISGSHSAKFHASYSTSFGFGFMFTPGSAFNYQGNMDLYLDCSGTTGNKEAYFYWVQPPTLSSPFNDNNTDSLKVYLSTDGGITFSPLWGSDTASDWTHVGLPIVSNSATTILRFQGSRTGIPPAGYTDDFQNYDLGIDSVYVAPPCNGMPTAGDVTPGGSLSDCAGTNYNLTLTGTSLAGNLQYKWQKSYDGGITWLYTGDTVINIQTGPVFRDVAYQCTVVCALTGDSSIATPVTISVGGGALVYASIPYSQSFENWINRCNTYDVPDSSWVNAPSSGNNSWRREDQGQNYGCWVPFSGEAPMPSPVSVDGKHCASIETYDAFIDCNFNNFNGTTGNFYLLSNCSTVPGTKQLQFFLNNPSASFSPNDSVKILMSTDNGSTFKVLGSFGPTSGWEYKQLDMITNSSQTIIDFQSIYGSTSTFATSNIGLDLVKILPPCQGKPAAGTLMNVTPCANADFTLKLNGTSAAGGLTYTWQTSKDGTGWNTITGDTLPIVTANISSNTYYRVIVTCTYSGLSDTSASELVRLAPFYVCYCDPTAIAATTNSLFGPISTVNNFSILKEPSGDTVYAVGNRTPLVGPSNPWSGDFYVKWDTLSPDISAIPLMYRDSLYKMFATIGYYNNGNPCSGSCFYEPYNTPVNIYLDMDHSGTYDPNELILNQIVDGPCCKTSGVTVSNATVTDTFTVPDTAMVGITGLRVLSGYSQSSPISPCGESFYSNQEIDFLVNISYRPCTGPVDAGTAVISDSTMCVGYSYTLVDTTHEYHQANISWQWQASGDDIKFGNTGPANSDTLTQTYSTPATTYYRLRMICPSSHDTTYSDTVRVYPAPAYACYCYSMAIGGRDGDSSDIGAFTIGTYIVSKGGPHILNPAATAGRTDHTGTTIDLDVDSTYPVGVYQVLRSASHGDAKITLFIDYNNNLRYDAPQERVWSTETTLTDWYRTTSLKIPDSVITDVPTGMRLILNNNTSPNAPSDEGCGPYTSGETQDFVVKFHREWPAGVGSISNMERLAVYPNPTTGKFTVEFHAGNIVRTFQITVSNATGQQVLQRSYSNTSGQFSTDLDMSEQPRGVYFIEFMADGERRIQKLIVR